MNAPLLPLETVLRDRERPNDMTDLERIASRLGGYWRVVRESAEGAYIARRMPTLASLLMEADRLSEDRDRQTVRDDYGGEVRT